MIEAASKRERTNIVIMGSPNAMSELVTQHFPDLPVVPKPVIGVRTYPQLDHFSSVLIQAEQFWMLVRSEFGEKAD